MESGCLCDNSYLILAVWFWSILLAALLPDLVNVFGCRYFQNIPNIPNFAKKARIMITKSAVVLKPVVRWVRLDLAGLAAVVLTPSLPLHSVGCEDRVR